VIRGPLLVALLSSIASPVFAQQDRSPFALHGGAAWASIPSSEFEVIGSLSGQDVFAQVDARDSTADFALFLSQRVAPADAPVDVYGTIGTGLSAPGRTLFFGGSVGVSRALVTLGLATGLVDRGLLPAPDEVFRAGAERTVYGRLERTREWGFFVAGSIVVF
jgi:hypothetical protein